MNSSRRVLFPVLLAALVLGVQMAAIGRPFQGHFASYQATVMASISRNMMRENFSELLLPKTDILIRGTRSLHLNQYPLPSVLAALGARFLGGSLEFWGRFQAIVFNVLSAVLLGLMGARLFDARVGWIAPAIFSLSPYTLIYGQSFMSEACALFFLLLAVFLLCPSRTAPLGIGTVCASALALSVAVTNRIHFALFFPVYFLYLLLTGGTRKALNLLFFTLLSLALPVAWVVHTFWVSLGSDHVHTSLFLQLVAHPDGPAHFLSQPDYYRRVLDTVSQMMLTPLLFPFFLLGFVLAEKKERGFWITVGSLALGGTVVVLAPEKVMKHDFYLYGVFPFLALLTALGVARLLDAWPILRTVRIRVFFLLLYFGISSRFFLHPIFGSGKDQVALSQLAQVIETHTQPDDRLIVAGKDLGSSLYYTNRTGWPLQFDLIGKPLAPYQKNKRFAQVNLAEQVQLEHAMRDPISWVEYLRGEGATFFVAPKQQEIDAMPELKVYLEQNYEVLSREDEEVYIVDLVP